MRILDITLTNWAQHEKVEAKDLGSSVLLLGENGSGKSNFINGVEYAFQGKIEQPKGESKPIASYIRGFGGPHAATFAETGVRFEHTGRLGTLKRRITASGTSRELVWDGRSYKKADDVEAVLDSLFGAKRKAISRASFLRQGMLDKMLFGSTAEREMHYMWLFGIDYLLDVAGEADRARALLKFQESETLDVSLSTLKVELTAHELRMQEMRQQMLERKSYQPDLDTLTLLETAVTQEQAEHARLMAVEGKIQGINEAITAFLAGVRDDGLLEIGLGSPDPGTAFRTEAERLANTAEETLRRISEASVAVQTLEAAAKAEERLAELDIALKQNEERAVGIPDVRADDLFARQTAIANATRLNDLKTRLVAALSTTYAVEQQLAKLEAEQPAEPVQDREEMAKLTSDGAAMARELSQIDGLLQALQSSTAGSCCPLCEQALPEGSVLRDSLLARKATQQAAVDSLRARYSETKRRIEQQEIAIATHRSQIVKLQSQLATNQEAGKGLQQQIAEISDPGPLDIAAETAAVGKMQEQLKAREQLAAERQNLLTRRAALPAPPDTTEARLLFSTAEMARMRLEELRQDHQVCQKKRQDLQNAADRHAELVKSRDEATATRNTLSEAVSRAIGSRQTLLERLSPEARSDFDIDQDVRNARDRVAERHKPYADALGGLKAVQDIATSTKEKIARLEEQMQTEKGRRASATGLSRISQVFSRTGIPQAFIRRMFERLAKLVQANLVDNGAGFQIRVSQEDPTAFEFAKADWPDYWQPQNNLSGGERVRLTTAFALASQQLLFRDFGFLTLDEPSMHLDTAGRENLAHMFRSIEGRLRAAQTQVIVSDHDPILIPSFESVIRLGA